MKGLMQNQPLLLSSLLKHADRFHSNTEIVSRTVEGPIHRYGYAEAAHRSRKLADALRRHGVAPGDRVATLAWNNFRHFEIEHGVTGLGAVWHAINPRLIPSQISYIVNHAQDSVLCFDSTFLPLVEKLAKEWPTVGLYVLMVDRTSMPASSLPNLVCYEEFIGIGSTVTFEWPVFDELSASSLFYTSGTTGNPKGRALFASLRCAACAYTRRGMRFWIHGAGYRPADDADVPRQWRLGIYPCSPNGGRKAGIAGPETGRGQHR